MNLTKVLEYLFTTAFSVHVINMGRKYCCRGWFENVHGMPIDHIE